MITLNAIEIVYPPSPENEWMAARLKRELSSYRIPSAVQKRTGISRLEEVERPALIVFCMPESIGDPEVEEAIARFAGAGLSKRVIALILGGPPGNRFPEALLHETLPDGTVVDREPLAANIAAPSRRLMLKKLETEKLRIIASILGVAFDDLKNRRRRQRARIAAAAGAVLLCGASAFLLYALSRVRVMSGQQEELSLQFAQAQAAQKEEEYRKDEEEEAFAGRIAVEAREALESGDSELSLLLCLELLPEMQRVDALTTVLRDTLTGLCREGYVPVTDGFTYISNRYGEGGYGYFRKNRTVTPEQFPETLYPKPPAELDCEKGYGSAHLGGYSEEQGCAVYDTWFKTRSDEEVEVTWVHFPQEPERDYYVRNRLGEYLRMDKTTFLPDGSFIGVGKGRDTTAYRVRIADGGLLPFFDEEVEGVYETESGGTVLLHTVGSFQRFEGSDVVFGYQNLSYYTEGYNTEVYSAQPFKYLETLENVNKIEEQKGTDYLFGSRLGRIPLAVYTRDPFSHGVIFNEGSEEKVSQYPDSTAVRLPDGRTVLLYHDDCVYTLPEGELLVDFHGEQFGGLRRIGAVSSEGWIQLTIRDEDVFWDVASGRVTGRIPFKAPEYPSDLVNTFCGPEDKTSGRCSASAYIMGGMVWEYRENAREVPDDLKGQMTMAEEMLRDRKLTVSERNKYHLD